MVKFVVSFFIFETILQVLWVYSEDRATEPFWGIE